MQLTNFAFMSSRHQYLDAQRATSVASAKIATTSRLDYSKVDTAAISQASKLKSKMIFDKSYIRNLQPARSFLIFQEEAYMKVLDIYQRMKVLSSESLTVPKGAGNPSNNEFNKLKKQLLQIKQAKFDGISIFVPVAICGEVAEIDASDKSINYTVKENDVAHTIRELSLDVAVYGGELSSEVNFGNAWEIYRVIMGNQQVFSTGSSFTGDPTQGTINRFKNSASQNDFEDVDNVLQSSLTNTDTWRTSDRAGSVDADTTVLSFGPGVETKYDISIGTPNLKAPANKGFMPQSNIASGNRVIRISNLDEGSSPTQLSIQVETSSIGLISDIEFKPQFFVTQLDTNATGDQIYLIAFGVETLEQFSVDSVSEANKTSEKLVGTTDSVGELECLSGTWLSKIASSINRIDSELSPKESSPPNNEIALGRIVDSDMTADTTNYLTQKLKMEMAEFVMTNTTRMNDILNSLTTENHLRAIMNDSILL